MTPLTFVEPTEVEPTMNILLYGPPGTGKTMGAATAPGPILWLNAEGPGAIRLARETHGDKIREVALEGMSDFDEAYLYLLSDEGKEIKTLVVDTLGEAYQIFFNEIEGPRKDHLKNHGDVQTKIERFVRTIRDLPVNVVVIAHEQIDDGEGGATRRPMTGGKKLPEKIMALVDVVGYTGVIPANEEEGTPRRYVAQLIESGGRRAKSRWESLGDFPDLDLTDWITTATSTNGTKEKASK